MAWNSALFPTALLAVFSAGAIAARPLAISHVTVIDGRGKYLIPGLWDMHVHFRGGDELLKENEATLPLFVSLGITGVREMGGDIVSTVLRWRQEIAAGRRIGPRIVTSGPKLDGPKPVWPGSI